jgi:hypothetical protein
MAPEVKELEPALRSSNASTIFKNCNTDHRFVDPLTQRSGIRVRRAKHNTDFGRSVAGTLHAPGYHRARRSDDTEAD